MAVFQNVVYKKMYINRAEATLLIFVVICFSTNRDGALHLNR